MKPMSADLDYGQQIRQVKGLRFNSVYLVKDRPICLYNSEIVDTSLHN